MQMKPFSLVLAAVVMTGAAACNRDEPRTPEATAQYGENRGENRDDGRITTAVQAKYYTSEDVRGRNVSVETQNGVVTLRGTVESEAAKQRAVALAREVEGVTNVQDELRVEAALADADTARRPDAGNTAPTTGATPGTDDTRRTTARGTEPGMQDRGREMDERSPGWITTKIQAQYFTNPEVKPWNIDVTTNNNGVVTLEGEVEGADDKAEAVRIAQQTEGVTRVEDRLRIKGEAPAAGDRGPAADTDRARQDDRRPGELERPDVWLTTKVQSKYFLDDDVKGRAINVDTRDGVVTLNGTVSSEAERRQAIALARNTDGVRDVVDRLQVVPQGKRADDPAVGTSGQSPRTADRDRDRVNVERPDAWITTKVQAKYFLDGDIKGRNIDVDTQNGVVTLTGTVENDAQKRLAEQIARDTEGVTRVQNKLTVGPRTNR
ncbi:MAG TPA: BON domain-containing protein [Vicinamibacterales bacterium]|nr:BON domain-containing protein [Vicinamibacterales bacterium]